MFNRYTLWFAIALLTGTLVHPMMGFAVIFVPFVILFVIHEMGD